MNLMILDIATASFGRLPVVSDYKQTHNHVDQLSFEGLDVHKKCKMMLNIGWKI